LTPALRQECRHEIAHGLVAVPTFRGWTPTTAINFGDKPTIFADLECPRCARDLTEPAGAALVAHFSEVSTSRRSLTLLAAFLAVILTFQLAGVAAFLFLPLYRGVLIFLMPIPLSLLGPLILYFNWQIASIRYQCACGTPAYKFMGLLGRSYCYRCSTCGRLLRIRD
jgi:hypothetical protein